MSTFQAIIGPMGIHQDAETSLSPPSRNGHVPGALYQQRPALYEVQGEGD